MLHSNLGGVQYHFVVACLVWGADGLGRQAGGAHVLLECRRCLVPHGGLGCSMKWPSTWTQHLAERRSAVHGTRRVIAFCERNIGTVKGGSTFPWEEVSDVARLPFCLGVCLAHRKRNTSHISHAVALTLRWGVHMGHTQHSRGTAHTHTRIFSSRHPTGLQFFALVQSTVAHGKCAMCDGVGRSLL